MFLRNIVRTLGPAGIRMHDALLWNFVIKMKYERMKKNNAEYANINYCNFRGIFSEIYFNSKR